MRVLVVFYLLCLSIPSSSRRLLTQPQSVALAAIRYAEFIRLASGVRHDIHTIDSFFVHYKKNVNVKVFSSSLLVAYGDSKTGV